MKATRDTERERMVGLCREAHIAYMNAEKTPGMFAVYLADYLMACGMTAPKKGEWFKEILPTPENAKNKNMEHYRLVCPFCGTRNGKRREKRCHECGAMLK